MEGPGRGQRGLTTLDVRDFEPRSTTPINGRLSPEKVPICTGFSAPPGSAAVHARASNPMGSKKKVGLLEGVLGAGAGRAPFTPVRMTRRRAESASPVMVAAAMEQQQQQQQAMGGGRGESSFSAFLPPAPATMENQRVGPDVGRRARAVGSLQLGPTYAVTTPSVAQSMSFSSGSSEGLPVPVQTAAPPRFRPSAARTTTSSSTPSDVSSPPLQPSAMLSPPLRSRELSPFPSPRPTSVLPSSPLAPSHLRSPPPQAPSSPLASPSTPKIRAKLTPLASPRRKALLPGAPNPESMPTPSSPVKEKMSLLSGMGHRLRAVASVPALRSRAQDQGWINGAADSPSSTTAGLGIQTSSPSFDWTSSLPPFASAPPSPLISPSNVLVCIRVRPANHATSKAMVAGAGAGQGCEAWVVDEQGGSLSEEAKVGQEEWAFDAVRSGSENSDVYDVAAKDLVLSCMHGYDTSIFAYGQTASGKTFTLTGSPSNPGVIPLSIRDVFSFIRSHPSRDFLLRASYLELYNETLRDLLADEDDDPKGVRVRVDPATGNFFPAGVREEVVSHESHVEALLARGESKRRVAGTEYNARSSRSHTVFTVTIESRDAGDTEGRGAVRMSRLSLIDLAGSERAVNQAERRAEGAFINKSLLTLEKVISALADSASSSDSPLPNAPKPHIPYRDSKLTQLLQPSLSGSARVAVVCTINPSSWATEESRSTLRFAKRCKKVRVRAEVREVVSEKALITRYRMQIAELQAQLASAVSMTSPLPGSAPSTPRAASTSSAPSSATSDDLKLREKRRVERERAEAERKELRQRLERLQSIVLNAKNVDQKRESGQGIERAVSPVKEGSEDGDDSDDTGRVSSTPSIPREVQLESEVAALRRELDVLRAELSSRPSLPANATPDEVDVRIGELEQEVRELKVVVANGEAEVVKEECERMWGAEREVLKEEVQRRREFEEDLRAELEEARNRCKKLELYIIDELSHTASNLARPRRSSLGSTLGYTVSTHQHRRRRLSLDNDDLDEGDTTFTGSGGREYDEFGAAGTRQRPEDALEALMQESPDMTCVRASFAGVDLDVGPEMEAVKKDWRRRTIKR